MSDDDFHKQATLPGVKRKGPLGSGKEPSIPQRIGPYPVEGLLDKGGMSLLYLGIHPESKDPITIKVLAPEYLSEPELVQRFRREAEIIALADHPNIVKLFGSGKWEGGLYIAMEFIQGISLKNFMTSQTMSLRRALEVTLDVAYALCHLHTHGVIHRDLKPENILMTQSGSIKVIDFGIAQLLSDHPKQPGARRRLMGTPIYMSPEQRENPEAVSFPSDIYSLAIIAYELVLGKLCKGVVQLSQMPKGLQPILAKALQPKIADRYQDVVDFISDLSAYLNSTAVNQEGRGRDRERGISEALHVAHAALLPSSEPQWPRMRVGFTSHDVLRLSGMYHDYFDLPSGAKGIILVEPYNAGEEGVVYSAVFRGMARTLAHLSNDPGELASIANELLCNDPMHRAFHVCYLVLKPAENLLQYLSCGYGALWHCARGIQRPQRLVCDYPALGLHVAPEFRAVSHPWEVGDTLVLSTTDKVQSLTSTEPGFSLEDFEAAIEESLLLSPQKMVDAIGRKILASAKTAVDQHPLSLLAIERGD